MLLGAFIALLLTPASPILSVPKVEAAPLVYTHADLIGIATSTAAEYHLNTSHFLRTIECESQFVPDQIGDQGRSHGIVQIFEPAHPEITLEQANDPIWALDWMGQQWALGNANLWSCWNNFQRGGWE